jgi:predicted RNase H-like HicB family nuclease
MAGYAIVIDGEDKSFSAYAPELPGCIATGKSVVEVEALMREAIEFHLEGMKLDGEPIPAPTTVATAIAEVG